VKKFKVIKSSSHTRPGGPSDKPLTTYLRHDASYYSNLLVWNDKRRTSGLPCLSKESISLVERIFNMLSHKVSYWPSTSGVIFGQNMGTILAEAKSFGYCGTPIISDLKPRITNAIPMVAQRNNLKVENPLFRVSDSVINNDIRVSSQTKHKNDRNKIYPIGLFLKKRKFKKITESGHYECTLCHKILKRRAALARHMNDEHQKKGWEIDRSLDEIDHEKRSWPLLPGSYGSGKHR
jgi:hypothetical protein